MYCAGRYWMTSHTVLTRCEKLLDIGRGPGYSRATCSLPDPPSGASGGVIFSGKSPDANATLPSRRHLR